QYSVPGILHYIQHEWARFEVDRASWDVERAELQRKGQENLKNDLVRRIKMLEYALKQERAKYHKLKYGTELSQGEVKAPSFETEDTKEEVTSPNCQLTWKQGRQLLRQYLQEVGYTDTILDVRSQRVRSLLGLAGSEHNGSLGNKNLENILNGTESPSKRREQDPKRSPGDVLETFNFLENTEDSDEEEEDEEGDILDHINTHTAQRKKHKTKVANEGLAAELADDVDTQEALKEFDFLGTEEEGEGAGEARSSGDGTEWAEPLPFPAGGGKSFLLGSEDVLENVLGLGDLADLTVANDDPDYSYDYTLRSHLDAVRALAFHPLDPCLLTVSEDHTLKLWNLTKTLPAKKSASFDVEPIYTFRAHIGAVLCVAMSSSAPVWTRMTLMRLLSCSSDGTVKLWDPQDPGGGCACTLNSDREHGVPTAVDFSGCDSAHMVASFTSGDVVLYDLETTQQALVLHGQGDSTLPGANHINKVVSHPTLPLTITAHEDRHIRFYDNKTGKVIHDMVAHLDAVTSLAVDPNGIYLMSGSHDCSVRLWTIDSRTCVQEITAHRKKSDEAIHDVAFHPSRAFIASAGADALARVYV
ncbi:hypothetical protein NHX12_019419, partial [Muraenolepis orangiensis]